MKKNKLHDAIEKVLFSDLGIFKILTSISKNCKNPNCEKCIFRSNMENYNGCIFDYFPNHWEKIIPELEKNYIENKKEKK